MQRIHMPGAMTLKDPFVEAFLDACYEGDLSKTQEAIASYET